jgi:hypothetical protein
VTVRIGQRTFRGRAMDIDAQGALLLEDENGGRQRFLAGDVSLSEKAVGEDAPPGRTTVGDKNFKGKHTCGW